MLMFHRSRRDIKKVPALSGWITISDPIESDIHLTIYLQLENEPFAKPTDYFGLTC